MATEAVKFLSGVGKNISGKLLVFNALETTLEKYSLTKDETCPICSENPTIESFKSEISLFPSITIEEIRSDYVLVDVREKHEFELFNIGGLHIPLGELPDRLSELDREKTLVLACQVGQRSLVACTILKNNNFNSLYNLEGGIAALGRDRHNYNLV